MVYIMKPFIMFMAIMIIFNVMGTDIINSINETAAVTPASQALPHEPFALKVKTGEAVYLGMSRDEAEAITGAPIDTDILNKVIYNGLILAYRDDIVVYILIDDEQWNINGIIELEMPTQEAVEKLGMMYEDGCKAYSLGYFGNDDKRQLYPGLKFEGDRDYEIMLTLYVTDTVDGIIVAEKQYGLTGK